jgi:hypothetical protein
VCAKVELAGRMFLRDYGVPTRVFDLATEGKLEAIDRSDVLRPAIVSVLGVKERAD